MGQGIGENTRALGIDFGEKRIGLAVSDPEGRLALPLATLERQTDRRAAYQIADIARREEVGVLVLGEPRRPDGSDSQAAQRVRRFADRLRRAARLPLVLIDEAHTTIEAAERLRAGSPSAALDAVAAQILLQEALDEGLADGARAGTAGERA